MRMTLIFLIVIDNLIAPTKVSKILNYTYKPKDQIPLEINDTTCRQCLCQALTSLDYSTIYLNCYESRRLCEIYFNYTTNYTIENSEESTFYFYPDPPPKIHTSGNPYLPHIKLIINVHHFSSSDGSPME